MRFHHGGTKSTEKENLATDVAQMNTDKENKTELDFICVHLCPIGGKNAFVFLRVLRASVVK
jgi:hypothetical protein